MTLPSKPPFDNDAPGQDLIDLRAGGDAKASFGARLRAAREARGLDIESCAHSLRLPLRVLRQLEAGDYDALDYGVYMGGYIRKYARHLDIDHASVEAEVARFSERAPTLVATGGVSHSRYLLERYATAATYVVLTAVIVVPVIWLGVRGTLDRDMSRLTPLDATPVAQQDAPARTGTASSAQAIASDTLPSTPTFSAADEQPLLASMVPNLAAEALQPTVVPPKPAAAMEAGNGGHALSLQLANPSWVEVLAADGSRLEYGLLPAGTSKTYRSDQAMEVRIGNATGAQVSVDGQPTALDDFRHSNVAHFRVQVADGKARVAAF